jgi:predicted anti-sigma-YlaC factor YlaD
MSGDERCEERTPACIDEHVLDLHHRGKLAAHDTAEVEQHLEQCERCRILSEEIRTEIEFEALVRAAESNLPPEGREAIIRKASSTVFADRDEDSTRTHR